MQPVSVWTTSVCEDPSAAHTITLHSNEVFTVNDNMQSVFVGTTLVCEDASAVHSENQIMTHVANCSAAPKQNCMNVGVSNTVFMRQFPGTVLHVNSTGHAHTHAALFSGCTAIQNMCHYLFGTVHC